MSELNPNSDRFIINDQFLAIDKIGTGGFGIVWKAYDFSLKHFVAIKELLPKYCEPKFIEMFYKEALIAKHLIHDNIVRVQNFWRGSNGSYYILMDYVAGCDLEYLLAKCVANKIKLPIEFTVLIIGNVLKAIYYANKQAKDPVSYKPYGITYRDISPGNVMLSFDGNIKLSDFGIAKTADETENDMASRQRIITGKYAYMSPEQIVGDPGVDHRSDIFSAGVMLYEILTYKPLFSGDYSAIKKQISEFVFDPDPLRAIGVPNEILEVLEKALSTNKENRYQIALEMMRDMFRVIRGKYSEELMVDFATFLSKTVPDELSANISSMEAVTDIHLEEVVKDMSIRRVICKDFIPGASTTELLEQISIGKTEKTYRKEITIETAISQKKTQDTNQDTDNNKITTEEKEKPKAKVEEKGKTVFEEVGDWVTASIKAYKRTILRVFITLLIAVLLFGVADVFLRITSFGKTIYSVIYPPDVVIETIPSGALVTLKTREGKVVFEDRDSSENIELRKIQPNTYMLEATKEGFLTVNRIIVIKDKNSNGANQQQRISVYFDFALNINSEPNGVGVYINGNLMGQTPWKGQLSVGKYALRLSVPGYEDLGSNAKEIKDGQCFIDLSEESNNVYDTVDKKFWDARVVETGGVKTYKLIGYMYKMFDIDSVPQNMIVHVENESTPRGNTPIRIPLRTGLFSLRLIDPSGKYKEEIKAVKVDKESDSLIKAIMKKWTTIKIKNKLSPKQSINGTVIIKSPETSISESISTDKPLRVALTPAHYSLEFHAGEKFVPVTISNFNVAEQDSIAAELEYIDTEFKVVVKSSETLKSINNAFVWINNKLVGNTNYSGIWQGKVKYGKSTLKIVSKDYIEQNEEIEFKAEKQLTLEIKLAKEEKEESVELSTSTNENEAQSIDENTPRGTIHKVQNIETKSAWQPTPVQQDIKELKPLTTQTIQSNDVVICPWCGAKYYDKRKRTFCTNCGKPLNAKPNK